MQSWIEFSVIEGAGVTMAMTLSKSCDDLTKKGVTLGFSAMLSMTILNFLSHNWAAGCELEKGGAHGEGRHQGKVC